MWSGRWRSDVDFNCNNCFHNRNFSGRIHANDIDWKDVDRSKLHIDRDQLGKLDRNNIRQGLRNDRGNDLRARAADVRRNHQVPPGAGKIGDIRKNALQNRPGGDRPGRLPGGQGRPGVANAVAQHPNVAGRVQGGGGKGGQIQRPAGGAGAKARAAAAGRAKAPASINRPVHAPKPGGRIDHRPKVPSGLGEIRSGRSAQIHSARGAAVRGGGQRAVPHRQAGGGRPRPHPGGRRH
ncbi:hypothetical protein [Ancylobacter mangrovi]|uniref:hypothetical protein n=1 Tax=Ancylobacter mangrovi TaxID=2972472 RepID=UPI002162FE0F|nr:hypothetical protein [Ancylobacter mangrovi]MCS0502938.1 hypothetical protein [Ancylobacter mangrovi]